MTVRKLGVVNERISCTVDELAEALFKVLALGSANKHARELACFLNADRIPEPVTDNEDWIYE